MAWQTFVGLFHAPPPTLNPAGLRGLTHSCSPSGGRGSNAVQVTSGNAVVVPGRAHLSMCSKPTAWFGRSMAGAGCGHGLGLDTSAPGGPGSPIPPGIAAPSISRDINRLSQVKYTTARALWKVLLPPGAFGKVSWLKCSGFSEYLRTGILKMLKTNNPKVKFRLWCFRSSFFINFNELRI